ncbi:hydrogenase maturation nickel metallochaperone HypA [Bacteroidota bacterium]
MHELSIAMNIIDIAEEYLEKAGASKVFEIDIEIGELSGVIPEALEFAMNHAVKDSVLDNAKIKIIHIRGIAKCKLCSAEFAMKEPYTPCPECSEYNSDIITGKEMRVKSLIVE